MGARLVSKNKIKSSEYADPNVFLQKKTTLRNFSFPYINYNFSLYIFSLFMFKCIGEQTLRHRYLSFKLAGLKMSLSKNMDIKAKDKIV